MIISKFINLRQEEPLPEPNLIAALKPRYIEMPVTAQERHLVKSASENVVGWCLVWA